MNKYRFLLLSLFFIAFLSNTPTVQAQIHPPDGLRMPGQWNDWANETGMGGEFDLIRNDVGTLRWQTRFQHTGETGNQLFKFVSTSFGNPWGNQWAGNNAVELNVLQDFVFGNPSEPDNRVHLTRDKWYTVVFDDKGYENTRAIFMETSNEPVSIVSVSQYPALVQSGESVEVHAQLSAQPSAEEKFFLRYTLDAWQTSVVLPMQASDEAYVATIPAQPDDTGVAYYVLSTTIANPQPDFDLIALTLNNNLNANYSYVVGEEVSCGMQASLITTEPAFPQQDLPLTLWFNARFGNGGLLDYTGDVYAHTGVITNLSTGLSDWRYVKSEWGVNADDTKLTRLEDNLYSLELEDVRAYYGVPAAEEILAFVFVFRSGEPDAEGNFLEHKTADNGDIVVEGYENKLNVKITSPSKSDPLVQPGQILPVCVEALENQVLNLYLNDELLLSENTSSHTWPLVLQEINPGTHWIVAHAGDGQGNWVYDSTAIYLRGPVISEELPQGVVNGVNYIDDTTVTFVLHDPPAMKNYAFVIGDFNEWMPGDDTYMKRTPDGTYFWLTLEGLEPGEEYAFQYYIDGELRLACPYTHKVLDPWNDRWIPEENYPDLKEYPFGKTTGIVSVLQTARTPYNWEVTDFVPEAIHATQPNLIIYEMLIRDFVESRAISDVIEKLDYLEQLGVNAIQLMPVNQFEGNDSWGYNPSFYFATDKAYGTREDYKRFIDEAHKRGIAVILDIVLNHSFNMSPLVQMYFDPAAGDWGKPLPQNPWYLVDCPHDWCWGNTFDQESPYVHELFNRITEYWLTEFKVDGFRFDFTKGFTNRPGSGWNYDDSRVANLKRIADHVWSVNPNAYVILEHFTEDAEERELANYGMMLWANMHPQFRQNTMGYEENHDFSRAFYQTRGFQYPNLIPFMESHDEDRLMYDNLNFGATPEIRTLETALRRNEAATVMYMTIPGPKMIWQFGEVGYDYSINYCPHDGSIDSDCRTAAKPIRWDYFDDENRQDLYWVYSAMTRLKTENPAFREGTFTQDLGGMGKRMWIAHESMNVSVSANFATSGFDMQPGFQHAGTWYNYFTGESFEVTDPGGHTIWFNPGDYYVFTSVPLERPDYTVAVTVLDAEDNQPLEGAQVMFGNSGQRKSDAEGIAGFRTLKGTHPLTVSLSGYQTLTQEVVIEDDAQITVLLEVDDLAGLYAVTFRVDMTPAIDDGRFNPDLDFVDMAGNFISNWAASSGAFEAGDGNIYSFTTEQAFEPGEVLEFKFRINGSWEASEFPDDPEGEKNRFHTIVEGENIYEGVYDTEPTTSVDFYGLHSFRVYPNPVGRKIHIAAKAGAQVSILDVKGRIVHSGAMAEDVLTHDMSHLPSGVYFVRIIHQNKGVVRKIIKR